MNNIDFALSVYKESQKRVKNIKDMIKSTKFQLLVKCAANEKFRTYAFYVNYTYQTVQAIAEALPREWDFDIQRC